MGAIFDSLVGSRPVVEEKLPTTENLGEFSKGLGRGFHGLRGTLWDFAGTVTEPIAPNTARKLYSYSDAAQQDAAQYPGRVTSLKDIHNVSDLGDFAAGGAGQALPSLLASVGVGGPVGVGLRAAGAGLGAATVGGLAAGSYPAVTGELAGSMRRDPTIMSDYTPAQRTGMALAGGVPLAAIDALPTARAVGKVIGPNLVNKGVKNAVLNTLKSGFQTGVEEGVAEGTQQAGQIAMLGAMNPERKSFDLQETADAFALGFFGGGVPLGSAAGAAQAIKSNLPGAVNKASDYLKSRRPATTEQELTQRDMADVGEAEALAGRILEADAPGSVRRLTEEFMSMAKRTGEDAELYLREVGNRFAASDAYEKGRVAAKALREKLFPGRDRRLGMAMFGDIKYDDPPATQSFRPGVDAPYYNRYAPDEVSPRGFGVEPDVEPLLSYLRAKDFVSGVSKNLGGETKYWQDVADYLVNQAEWDSADNSLLSSMQEWIGSKFGAVLSKNETGEMIVPDERLVKAVEGFSDKMKFTYEAMKLGGQSVPSQAAFDEVYNIVKSYESAEDMQMQQGKKETYDEESSDDIGTNEFEPNELQTEDVYIGKSEFADVPFESIGNKVKIKELQDNIRGSGGLARTIGVWDKAKRQAKDDADLRRREDELLKKYRKEPFTDREEALLDVNSKFVYLLDQRVNRPEGTVVRGEEFNNVSSKNNKWSVQAKNFPGPEHGTVWFKRKDGVEFATSVSKLIALGRKGSVTGETEGLAEQRDALLTGISSFLTAENADGSAALQGVYGFKEGADISWTDISKAANASSADFSLRKGGGKSLATMVRGGAGYLPASLKLFDGTVADIEQAKVRKTKYAVGSRDEKSAKKYIDYVTKKFETKDQNRKAYEEFIKESPTFKQELAAYGNEKDATAAVKRREKEAHGLIKTGALSQGQEALLNKLKAATSTSEAFKLAMQLNIEGSARRTVDYARSLGYEQEAATLEDLLGTENWGKVGAELDNLSELLAKAGFNKEENEGVSDLTKITEDKHPIRSLREDLTKPNKAMGERDASGEIARPAPTGELATGPKIDVVPKVGKSVKQYAAERLAAAQRLFGDKSWGDEKGKQWLLDEMVRLNKLYESASDEVFTEKTTKEESEGIPKANEARLAERKPAEPKGEPLPTPEQSYGLLHKEDDTDSKIKQSLEKLGFTNVRPLIGSNYRKLKDVRTDKAIDGVFVYDKGNGVNYSIASRDKLIVGLRSDTITAENYTDAVKKLYAEPAKSAEPAKPLTIDVSSAPAFAKEKEAAKAKGADWVLAAESVPGSFASRIAAQAKTQGKLITDAKDVKAGDVVYLSVPGASREFQMKGSVYGMVPELLEQGAVIRMDTNQRAHTSHNKTGEGVIYDRLKALGYTVKETSLYSEWSKSEKSKTAKTADPPVSVVKNLSGIQDNLGSPLTEAEQKEIKEHIEKLLGPKINTSFVEEVLGKLGGKAVNFSADWGPGVIRIMSRLTFGSAMDAANHESMHELFNLLRNEPAAKPLMDILLKAANAAPVVKQLERLLERHPAAMKQIHDKSPEFENERLAYMFQFWQAGKLVIGSETKSVFQKIRDWIRKVVGLLSEDQKAELIFRRFAEGQLGWGMAENPSEVAKILADDIQSRGTAIKKIGEWTRPAYNALSKLAFTAQGQLEDSNNPVLKKVSRMFNVPTGESGDQGMYEARAQMSSKFLNRFENDIAGASKADLALALEYLQKEDGSIPRAEEARKVFLAVRKLLDDLHPYITQSGIERFNAETNKWETIPYRKNYFTVVYDMEKIAEDPSAFVKDLVDNHSDYIQERLKELKFDRWNDPARHEEYARAIVNRLLNSQGAVELDETTWSLGFSPLMTAVNKRSLDWIKPEIRSKYQNKDLVGTMTSYIMQSVKRAEYVRRFGNDGDKLRDLIVDAKDAEVARMARERSGGKAIHKVSKEEWKEMEDKAAEIIKKYHPAIMALEGTLGYDINPTLRELSAGMMVYQNFRILVTSLFSSLIDPLGIMVRGGTAKNAYDTFIRGVKEVGLRWKGEKSKDEATKLAEMMGTVDAGTFLEALGQTYSSLYMYGKVKRWNDWLFKINGMEAWTRATRVGATQAAIEFIQKHMATPTDNSKRWLDELFGENQRPVLVDGKLDTTDKKVQMAVMKWVDGAILRPNAAQRPSWASDPHWALVWHMKQFTYTFHKVILERVWNEAYKHGNIEPMMLLMATYIPMMIAADAAKALLITGDEPYWMKEGLSGQISHGAVRANLMGIPQLPLEAYNKDVAQIAGPSAEWVKDWVTEPAGEQALGSLPFGSVVRQWG